MHKNKIINKQMPVKFIYLTNYLKETVTDSQIINWLELLQENGYVFDLVVIVGLKPFFQKKKKLKEKIIEARKKLKGKVNLLVSVKPGTRFGQYVTFLLLMLFFIINILKNEIIIIQTRTSIYNISLSLLKKIFPKTKIVFDSRAASAEEFLLLLRTMRTLNDNIKFAEKKKSFSYLDYKTILERENNFAKLADAIFCVSEKLKNYHITKCNHIESEKIIVIPGCADTKAFYYDPGLRKKMRSILKLEGCFVFIYAGGLNQAWQVPDYLFNVMSIIFKKNKNAHLLCLTPHAEIVHEFVKKHNIESNRVKQLYVKYSELNKYLNASDAGILFREDSLTNNVASPTKFAEYIMSGLPVVISDKIGEFSELVKKEQLGVVLNYNITDTEISKIKKLTEISLNRQNFATKGKMLLSKQSYLEKIIIEYKRLTG